MSNPQDAFINVILGAMKLAACGEITQLRVQLQPDPNVRQLKQVRIVVLPEQMEREYPTYAPLGTPQG